MLKSNSRGFAHPLLIALLVLAFVSVTVLVVSQKTRNIGFIYSNDPNPSVAGVNTAACDPSLVVGANEKFSSITAAVNSVKNNAAGKVVCVRNNKIYNELVRIDASGAVGNPLVVKSHPDNNGLPKVTTTAPYPTWQNRLSGKTAIGIQGDNVEIEGFEVTRSTGGGIATSYVENVKIRNVIAHDTYGDGLQVLHSKNVLVSGCKLYNNEMIGTVTDCIKQSNSVCKIGEVLKVRFSNNVTVENCIVTDDKSPKRGGVLNMGDSSNLIIRNNELYKHDGNHLHMGGAENVLVENNYVFGICGFEGKGFYRNAERQPADANAYDYPGKNITVRNNLIVGMRSGLFFGGCEVKKIKGLKLPWIPTDHCQFENVLVENNTVVSSGVQPSTDAADKQIALWLDNMQGDPVKNVAIRNNIFHSVDHGTGAADLEDIENKMSGDYILTGNIWHDNSRLSSGDRQVPNLAGVFVNSPDLNRCLTSRVSPESFRVTQAFTGKGVDTSKIGASYTGSGGEDIPADSDNDGVPNSIDQCPNTPAGANPDPARPGCPIETAPVDTDGDGVLDSDDVCPNIVAGTNPDPAKPGCPLDDVTPPTEGGNILLNSTFARKRSEPDEFSRFWTFTQGKLGDAHVFVGEAKNTQFSAGNAVKLTIVRNPITGYASINQKNVDLSPDKDYQIFFTARSSAPGNVYFTFVDMGYIEQVLAPRLVFNVGTTWGSYSATIRSGTFDPNKAAKVTVGYKAPDGSVLHIDNVRLIEL